MARMLTEEEVKRMEEQRALRERAQKAGNPTAGMSWIEKERYNQQQLNDRFRQAHEDAMERKRLSVLANPAAEANTNYRHSVMRDDEMRAARAHEMDRLDKELETREKEAHEKRMGMREQGRDAAEFNKEAAIKAAELQTARAKEIAGINAQSNEKIADINAQSKEKINKDNNDTNVDVATITKEGNVDVAKIQAEAQEKRQMAENLMRERQLDDKSAIAITEAATEMVKNSKNKRTGVPTMTYDEAVKKVLQQRKATGQSVGTPRPLANWGV